VEGLTSGVVQAVVQLQRLKSYGVSNR
jgi:hypothetical protein